MSIRRCGIVMALGLGSILLLAALLQQRPSAWHTVHVNWVCVCPDGSAWFTDTDAETYRVPTPSQARRCLPFRSVDVRYVEERLDYWRTVVDLRPSQGADLVPGVVRES